LYLVRGFHEARSDDDMQRWRHAVTPEQNKTEWERRWKMPSRLELEKMQFVNKPVLGVMHMGDKEPSKVPRRIAGRVFSQWMDPETHSAYYGLRAMDGVMGKWMVAMMEDPEASMRGVSLGHRIFLRDGQRVLSADEISLTALGQHPFTGVVRAMDYEYPPNLKWDSEEYKLDDPPNVVIRLPDTVPAIMATASADATMVPPGAPTAGVGAPAGGVGAETKTPAAPNATENKADTSVLGKRGREDDTQNPAAEKRAKDGESKDVSEASFTEEDAEHELEKALESITDLSKNISDVEARKLLGKHVLKAVELSAAKKKAFLRIMEDQKATIKQNENKLANMSDDNEQAQQAFIDSINKLSKLFKQELAAPMRKFTEHARTPGAGILKDRDLLMAGHAILAQASFALDNNMLIMRDSAALEKPAPVALTADELAMKAMLEQFKRQTAGLNDRAKLSGPSSSSSSTPTLNAQASFKADSSSSSSSSSSTPAAAPAAPLQHRLQGMFDRLPAR